MTREKIKRNLIQALDRRDRYVDNETLEKFLDLNYNEDWDWDIDDFMDFVDELCANFGNFWETVRSYDLHCPEEYKEESK